jgi:hypothetical protein
VGKLNDLRIPGNQSFRVWLQECFAIGIPPNEFDSE